MGLVTYVYPRFAVPITAGGRAISIDRLRAHALWYPGAGRDGLMVSGHVLYMARALEDAVLVALEGEDPGEADVAVQDGEPGISHRLSAPIRTSRYASVPMLIEAIIERVQLALPSTKRRLRRPLQELAPPDAQPEALARAELLLQQEGIHVLVPLLVGERYQLFTDATEALLPVSPLVLGRQTRLCFVFLSTDSLVEKREGSPWLRQAAEWLVLPVASMRSHPQVVRFIEGMPPLRPALEDEYLLWDLAASMHDMTGGWPDLADRFYRQLLRQRDLRELRSWLCDVAGLLRAAERDPSGQGDALLQLGLGSTADLPDLPPPGEGTSAAHEVLLSVVGQPAAFRWEDHGRTYLDGLLGWEQGLAVPRSRAIDLALRGRLVARAAKAPSGIWRVPLIDTVQPPPAGPKLRWLHISDLHFKAKEDYQSKTVLAALLATVQELRERGRTVDLVFITGDLAFSGRKEEYARAEVFLTQLCAAAGVPRSAVHMVPGNHDVDRAEGLDLARTLADADAASRFFEEPRRRPHLAKLEAFRTFYNQFYAADPQLGGRPPRQAASGQATAGPEIIELGRPGERFTLGLLPLNSAWFAQDEEDAGKLFVGEQVVERGLRALGSATLRLAFMHHPLSDLSDVERRLVQERLFAGCHFLLRGHVHETEMQVVSSGPQQTLTLAAGASYQARVPGAYQNRALYVEVELQPAQKQALVRPYPIRYEYTGHDRWTLDTSVYPRSYPTYLETLTLPLEGR